MRESNVYNEYAQAAAIIIVGTVAKDKLNRNRS